MTEKLIKKILAKDRKILPPSESVQPARKRGRPKGSKNKKKATYSAPVLVVAKKRGRPRKAPQISAETAEQLDCLEQLDTHPILEAVKWLEKNMHPTEIQYYRSRASKLQLSVHAAMASDILGFFNVQNADICKAIKKNNFIANVH